ncbi:MAG: hypothetical protein KGD64_06635 [Candidatus Heimdallarchaeota archaeon]|nr:hypothetical protein [Candidatus Heimdallarchaeota archaeon]
MGLRVFSVKRDGSYFEVPSEKESFHRGDGAYLIVDRKDKKIFIYRKMGISSALAYSAGRAATNLNTQKGSRYRIINIEEEEKNRFLPSIYQKLEASIPEDSMQSSVSEPISRRSEPISQSIVYGEKTIPIFETPNYSTGVQPIKQDRDVTTEKIVPMMDDKKEIYKSQNIDELVKTLANQILFETKLDEAKNMDKPARHIVKAELVKKLDSLLDSVYECDN